MNTPLAKPTVEMEPVKAPSKKPIKPMKPKKAKPLSNAAPGGLLGTFK